MKKKLKKVVILGGGVGSSTFTKALKDLPIELTTIVSAFDDGGSTGALRRDYQGFALGDFRQCVVSSLNLQEKFVDSLNYRFGHGSLYGSNVGNLLLKSFLYQYKDEREAVNDMHTLLKMENKVMPISYTFAKLCAKLENGKFLSNQQEIAEYLSFSKAQIKEIFLDRKTALNPDAKRAIIEADLILFAPGNFFTSLLPHIFVPGFGSCWKKSKAKKVWFVNLMAHKGQDSFFTLTDYIDWFKRKLGSRPFGQVVLNKKISEEVVDQVQDRFEPLKVTEDDLEKLQKEKVEVLVADIVSSQVRKQNPNDLVLRAPLRHDYKKIRNFVKKII